MCSCCRMECKGGGFVRLTKVGDGALDVISFCATYRGRVVGGRSYGPQEGTGAVCTGVTIVRRVLSLEGDGYCGVNAGSLVAV